MIFTIDAGNTRTKLAIFETNTLLESFSFKSSELLKKIQFFFQKFTEPAVIVLSSVVNIDASVMEWLEKNAQLVVINHQTMVPFTNNYTTPNTLGVDRIVLASGGTLLFPKQNKLIIDIGTCITYDFIDSDETYHGGAISPGFGLRYKSLNDYTAKLPLLELEEIDFLIGHDTQSSIQSGIVNGVTAELDGIIDNYRMKYSNLTVILTGGDSVFLAKRLKNAIFVNSTFLLESLNLLYQYTIENGKKHIS